MKNIFALLYITALAVAQPVLVESRPSHLSSSADPWQMDHGAMTPQVSLETRLRLVKDIRNTHHLVLQEQDDVITIIAQVYGAYVQGYANSVGLEDDRTALIRVDRQLRRLKTLHRQMIEADGEKRWRHQLHVMGARLELLWRWSTLLGDLLNVATIAA